MATFQVLLLLVIFTLAVSNAFPGGAGAGSCASFKPGHGVEGQDHDSSPWELSLTAVGSVVTAIISSDEADKHFKGFLLTDVNSTSDNPTGGSFTIPASANFKKGPCTFETVTHKNPQPKESITVEWKAPEAFEGKVCFRLDVVKEFTVWWLLPDLCVNVAPHLTVVEGEVVSVEEPENSNDDDTESTEVDEATPADHQSVELTDEEIKEAAEHIAQELPLLHKLLQILIQKKE